MKRLLCTLLLLLFPHVSQSQTRLESLDAAYESMAWQAVGMLEIGAFGRCTAVLIATDLALTAAHCLVNADTGAPVSADILEFRAGERSGIAAASRGVARFVVHEGFVSNTENSAQIAHDLALLRLAQPINNANIQPFQTGPRLRWRQRVTVVSFAHDRTEALSRQDECRVYAVRSGVAALYCDVDLGSSGAPVFRIVDDTPELVAIVSAKGEHNGEAVALVVHIEELLPALMTALNADQPQGARRLRVGTDSGSAVRITVGE